MEPKYYVPEISEFCIGFEFEIFECSGELEVFSSWQEHCIKSPNSNGWIWTWERLNEKIKTEELRVKYLDTSDIEEEGFKFVGKEEYLFEKDIDEYSHLEVDFDPEELTIVITELYQAKLTTRVLPRETREYNVLFNGKIKNVSEFRKVLKMLDIK